MILDFSNSINKFPNPTNQFEKEVLNFLKDWISDEESLVVHTSGSTGSPKPIQVRKQVMKNSAIATANFLKLKKGNSALLCLSPNYIAAKMMIVRAHVIGLKIKCVNPIEDLTPFLKTDFCAMVPLQVNKYINELNKIHQLIIGGSAVSIELVSKLQNKTTKCYETFGMTETVSHFALKSINGLQQSNYFKTLPNVSVKKDQRGCLVVNAPNLVNGDLVTNDLVDLKSGHEFKWLGRYDNIINSGGIKIMPETVEEQLKRYIKEPFFIASLPDENLGEKVVLVVESNNEIPLTLNKWIENRYHIPKQVFFAQKFTRTNTGKINREFTLNNII